MTPRDKIYVAGHTGLVGSAIVRKLRSEGYYNLVLRSHADLDLTDQLSVRTLFEQERPGYVFLAAARVGGILANDSRPADFIRDNLLIESNVIAGAWRSGVKKLLFLKDVVGFERDIEFDSSKPDGTQRKLLDVSVMRSLGWRPAIGLREGIRETYAWYGRRTKGENSTALHKQQAAPAELGDESKMSSDGLLVGYATHQLI